LTFNFCYDRITIVGNRLSKLAHGQNKTKSVIAPLRKRQS